VPPNDSRSDQELVAAANAGDLAAFEALYVRYRDWTLRVACRFTHNRDDALDVLQETFLYLLNKFPGFRLTARLTTFLYPAIRNTALTHRRKRRQRTDSRPPDDADLISPAPASPLDDDLATILAALTDDQREVLLMRFVDDMTPTEIADALAIPVGTAKSRLHAAITRLRADPAAQKYFTD
jgi:RNA polymerase sigma-70 factor (ECF subfamily)